MSAAGLGAPSSDALDAAPGADLPQWLHLVHGDRHTRAIPHHRPSQVWYGMVWYGVHGDRHPCEVPHHRPSQVWTCGGQVETSLPKFSSITIITISF